MELNQQLYNKGTLAALAYFDVFDFPLTKQEIFKYSQHDTLQETEKSLSELLAKGIIFHLKDYYSLRNASHLGVKRDENAARAQQYQSQAKKKSKLISQFPYVRGVFISGSLSKGVIDEDGDIDFFIVTQPNRLWVARSFLILFKKIFLLNSRKYFCINYLVDENSLEIEQKNRFTAVELLSLFPMVNSDLHTKIIHENSWTQKYFSGDFHQNPDVTELKTYAIKSALEGLFNGALGNRLDDLFLKITLKRWMRKFGKMPEEDFKIALKTSKKVSKHHPSNFQKKVMKAYEDRMETLLLKLDEIPKTTIVQA